MLNRQKKMINYNYLNMRKILLIACAVIFFSGCKELTTTSENTDLIKVGLSLTGEVSVSEESLTKAEDSAALLGIQVYQGTTPYAWGLFDKTEGINLYLHTGKEYSIVCQYIKNGKETLHYFSESDADVKTYILSGKGTVTKTGEVYYVYLSDGPKMSRFNDVYHNFHRYSWGYSIPFDILDQYDARSNTSDQIWCYGYTKSSSIRYKPNRDYSIFGTHTICGITNGFKYDSANTINVSASEVTKNPSATVDIDRYYGESGSFTATAGSETISLNMKHLVYGIQCNVTGVSDGTASITIKNGDNTILEKTDISSEYHSEELMLAFSDMHSAWQYSDNYTENITVSMTWLRGVGVTQDLGSQVVQVKRNCLNVITVSLSATKASAALGVESESADMNNESEDCSTHF